jgi:hypothetical protein
MESPLTPAARSAGMIERSKPGTSRDETTVLSEVFSFVSMSCV